MRPLAATDACLDACPKCNRSDAMWLRSAGVCMACENARVLAKVREQDRVELAHMIASTDSVARIQRLCVVTGDGWFDPTFALAVPGPETDLMQSGIHYLELGGLLERHRAFPDLFRLAVVQARPS